MGRGEREGECDQEGGHSPAHGRGPSFLTWPHLAAKEAGKYCVRLGGRVPTLLLLQKKGKEKCRTAGIPSQENMVCPYPE